ncbi:peptidoglycan-associated lipoprotein Pal [Xylophilus sp.]|uniref:peptidoglycan-associated lipoprotein Pal n=1 Tax=Xylophilus sp. TaxID=2653893 RepID=UPI0013B97BB4|nr:peptidoglycan-associated lipoprotein Pal [Xylophilus sp.]KAF1049297.1 MAG: Peptidoglycan-associated lipoprotein [Xylophilus sp.]
MIKRISLALAVAALIAGCSSGTKLNETPVEDRSSIPSSSAGANSGAAGQSGVAGVNLNQDANSAAGPVGVARIVYFDFDSSVVKGEYQSVVDAHARFLKANPNRRVSLEGHTDERGGREYNLALGQKRAEAVRRALTLLGVNDGQIEAVSFGKEKPAVQGSDESAYAQNRRVEFSYR